MVRWLLTETPQCGIGGLGKPFFPNWKHRGRSTCSTFG
jgi:hypothetical protein